jgi:hypothetical protein
MIKNQKKLITYLSILICAVVICFGVYKFISNQVKNETNPVNFSDHQKLDVLQKLKDESTVKPLSLEEKQELMKKLNAEPTKAKTLTEEEKLNILNSLSNPK